MGMSDGYGYGTSCDYEGIWRKKKIEALKKVTSHGLFSFAEDCCILFLFKRFLVVKIRPNHNPGQKWCSMGTSPIPK